MGRSFIQWREREERTASKEEGGKGKGSFSEGERSVRVRGRALLKGREESRFRRVGELSAQVRWLRRVESVGCVVRARAMWQALAPRSRTEGKCRFMSCGEG